jgi:putative membrane protein
MMILAKMDLEQLASSALSALIFGFVGILLMVAGFKAFDWITPKLDIEKELAEKHNLAVAIVIASAILGISYIVAKIVSA